MSAHAANQKFAVAVKSERKITGEILKQILEFEDNKYHIELGFHSLFDWLTRGHGYDEGSAYRRISAARAMRAVPEVEQKLQDGKTTMTNLAKAQTVFRQAGKLSNEQKREALEKIEGQTTAQATQTLFTLFPEAASKVNQDRKVVIDENQVRVSYNMNNEQAAIVQHARELLSHAVPSCGEAELITYLAKYFIIREDPAVKAQNKRRAKASDARSASTGRHEQAKNYSQEKHARENHLSEKRSSTAVASKHRVTVKVRAQVIHEDGRQCTYTEPITGMRCINRVRLETDHIQMQAHGGTHERDNLRCFCRVHNQFMAEKKLGKTWANWRRQN